MKNIFGSWVESSAAVDLEIYVTRVHRLALRKLLLRKMIARNKSLHCFCISIKTIYN